MNEKKETPSAEKAPAPPRETFQKLKAAREARGLSLSDIFKATRISIINLTTLENGDFHLLPPPVYTKNFIQKYARAVGIDEIPLLSRYERYLESLNPPREDPGVQKPWPETGRRYRFLFGSLGIVILAGILVYALFLYDQSSGTAPSPSPEPIESLQTQQASPEPVIPAASPVPAAPGAPAASTIQAKTSSPPLSSSPILVTEAGPAPAAGKASVQRSPAVSGKMLHLVIETRELSWIRITEDKSPPYQVLLKPGDRIERLASDYFLIDIGNAAGVNLIYQGKSLGSLGKQGQVVHLRLPEKEPEKKSP